MSDSMVLFHKRWRPYSRLFVLNLGELQPSAVTWDREEANWKGPKHEQSKTLDYGGWTPGNHCAMGQHGPSSDLDRDLTLGLIAGAAGGRLGSLQHGGQ